MNLSDLLIAPAYAAEASSSSPFSGLLFIVAMFGLMYFLLIRPQQKRAKAHKKLLVELKEGDEIVTNGGVVGVIKLLDDSFVIVEIADGVVVKIQKQSVNQKVPKGTASIKKYHKKQDKKLTKA